MKACFESTGPQMPDRREQRKNREFIQRNLLREQAHIAEEDALFFLNGHLSCTSKAS